MAGHRKPAGPGTRRAAQLTRTRRHARRRRNDGKQLGVAPGQVAFRAVSPPLDVNPGRQARNETNPNSFKPLTAHGGRPDNVLAAGQTILLPAHAGATTIGLLGTSTNGASSGPVTVHYTDGSTSAGQLSFSDWAGSASPGENTAASIPYRNSNTGTSQLLTVSVYEVSLPLTPGKTAASVTLPYIGTSINGATAMHIFAIAQG